MTLSTWVSGPFKRNRTLIGIVTATFFSVLFISIIVAYALFLASPSLLRLINALIGTTSSYTDVPRPYTSALYRFIFLNNIGHFWDPLRIWVWIPFLGVFSLGYELVLNAVVIGGVLSFTALTKGIAYAVAGVTPHGVFEIPAFILEFAALARWHVTTSRAIYARLSARKVERSLLIVGIQDTLFLSIVSVGLFALAAYVEAFVTPHFLGLQ
jgi:stage II sporulation protein M